MRHQKQLWWYRPFINRKWPLVALAGSLLVLVVWRGMGNLAGAIGGVLGVLLLGGPIDAWLIRKRFRKSPFYDDEISVSVSASGAHIVGKDSAVRLGWSSFTRARRFADGLLLFQGPALFNWLPDAAADDKAAVENAQALARAHIRDYAET